jgi:hypothetical protein
VRLCSCLVHEGSEDCGRLAPTPWALVEYYDLYGIEFGTPIENGSDRGELRKTSWKLRRISSAEAGEDVVG